MNNELLAQRVKDGDQCALLRLWEGVQRFVEMKAGKYVRVYGGRANIDDLTQAGFFAVLDAVKVYDPDRGAGFLTMLKYTMQTRFSEEMGIRSSKRDALQYSQSINEPMFSDNESIPVFSQIEDESAALAFMDIEYSDLIRCSRLLIYTALGTLPKNQATLLTAHYLKGKNFEESARMAGYSCAQAASDAAERATYHLANGKHCRQLRACLDAFIDSSGYRYAAGARSCTRYQHSGMSSTEAAAFLLFGVEGHK